jgi:hypothetical protein
MVFRAHKVGAASRSLDEGRFVPIIELYEIKTRGLVRRLHTCLTSTLDGGQRQFYGKAALPAQKDLQFPSE